MGCATLCVNSPFRCIPRSGRSAAAPSPANRIGLRCKKLEIDPGSAHKVVARWRRGACLQLPVLELLRFAASSTGRAQLRNVAGQLDGARQAREDRKQQNVKEKEQSVGVFVKRNFLGVGKSYTIKGQQAEKKAENAPCGRLKCVLMAGNIKPLPTSEKRLRQG